MQANRIDNNFANSSDACSSCPQSDECRDVWAKPNKGPFSAVGLVISSILVFILPIVTAIIAAAIVKSRQGATGKQIVAALIGLLIGVGLAACFTPLVRRRFPADKCSVGGKVYKNK